MGTKRQKTQLELAFMSASRGETPRADCEGTELPVAKHDTESPAATEHVCSLTAQPTEPPWYGPVCPVVWEEGGREASSYPD